MHELTSCIPHTLKQTHNMWLPENFSSSSSEMCLLRDILVISHWRLPKNVISESLRREWSSSPEVLCVVIHKHTPSAKTYRTLWPRSRGGSARRTRWETRGLRTSWARSPAAPGGCKGLCGNREAVATADTFGSVRRKHTHTKTQMYVYMDVKIQHSKITSHGFGAKARGRMTCRSHWRRMALFC